MLNKKIFHVLVLVIGILGILSSALITEFPWEHSFEISIFVGIVSVLLTLYGIEYFTRNFRLVNNLEAEQNLLNQKIRRLQKFISSKKFNAVTEYQKGLLRTQLSQMIAYETTLQLRIADLSGA